MLECVKIELKRRRALLYIYNLFYYYYYFHNVFILQGRHQKQLTCVRRNVILWEIHQKSAAKFNLCSKITGKKEKIINVEVKILDTWSFGSLE